MIKVLIRFNEIFRPIMVDKFKCKFDNLINMPYGFKYEIKDQQLHIVKKETVEIEETDQNNKADVTKDNRNLIDKTENQKLSRDEIEKMKNRDNISGKVCSDC